MFARFDATRIGISSICVHFSQGGTASGPDPLPEASSRPMPDISVAQYGCVRQHLVFDNLLSTPAFDCNMGCQLAGDRLVGRCSGNSRTFLDAS